MVQGHTRYFLVADHRDDLLSLHIEETWHTCLQLEHKIKLQLTKHQNNDFLSTPNYLTHLYIRQHT